MKPKKLLLQTITATLVLSTLLSALCVHAGPQNNGVMPAEQLNTELAQAGEAEEVAQLSNQIKELQQQMAMLHHTQLINFRIQQLEYTVQQLELQLAKKKNSTTAIASDALKLMIAAAPLAKHLSMPSLEQTTRAGKFGGYAMLTALCAQEAYNQHLQQFSILVAGIGIYFGVKGMKSIASGE